MKNWHDESVTLSSECPWLEDSNDALLVAEKLGIPFQTIDLSEAYKQRIVDYMFHEYEQGRTPNPDILCNREIKFDLFLNIALKLGADFVATGHYCQKDHFDENGRRIYRLLAGADPNKDQSYFLCQLQQEQLAHALFPIGSMKKAQVREIASKLGLVTAEKKDSQGLCFVGKVRLPDFLQQQLQPKSGPVIEVPAHAPIYQERKNAIENLNGHPQRIRLLSESYHYEPSDGEIVGEHEGAHYFTIGQRKGLQVGGKAEPLFVIATDTENNVIYTGMGAQHPGLNRSGLFIPSQDVHWLRSDIELEAGQSARYDVRIRYRQPLQAASLHMEDEGLFILFDEPQRGITPGQFAAWYIADELIGSGVIH